MKFASDMTQKGASELQLEGPDGSHPLLVNVDKSVIKHIPSGIYNIGGGEFLSIRSLIERLFAIYHVPCDDSFFGKETRRDGDIKSLCLCGDKLKIELGEQPSATIEDIFQASI